MNQRAGMGGDVFVTAIFHCRFCSIRFKLGLSKMDIINLGTHNAFAPSRRNWLFLRCELRQQFVEARIRPDRIPLRI